MSLFENRSDFGAIEEQPPDVVHLGSHGCDALFSRYSGDTHAGPSANNVTTRTLIIQGKLVLDLAGQTRILNSGDWFEIPPGTEYSIHFCSDCSLIEFSFDPAASA